MSTPVSCLLVTAMALGGCAAAPPAGDPSGARAGVVLVPLIPSRANIGEIGQVALAPRGAQTDLAIMVSGVAPQVSRPVHLHVHIFHGRCDRLAGAAEFSLAGPSLTRSDGRNGPYRLNSTVLTALAQLQAMPHAVLVSSTPADGGTALFCGNIG